MEIEYLYDILHWKIFANCTRNFTCLPSNYFSQRYLYKIRRAFRESQILKNTKKETCFSHLYVFARKK